MKQLFAHLTALLKSLFAQPEADPLSSFDPRDWADLPVYHPLADPDPKARC